MEVVTAGDFFLSALSPNKGSPFESVGPTPYEDVTQSVVSVEARVEFDFCVLLVAEVFFAIFTTLSVLLVLLLFLFKFSIMFRGDEGIAAPLVTRVVFV